MGCWRGYVCGSRCRFAYGPADATVTHYLLLQLIQIGFTCLVLPFWCQLTRVVLGKIHEVCKMVMCVCACMHVCVRVWLTWFCLQCTPMKLLTVCSCQCWPGWLHCCKVNWVACSTSTVWDQWHPGSSKGDGWLSMKFYLSYVQICSFDINQHMITKFSCKMFSCTQQKFRFWVRPLVGGHGLVLGPVHTYTSTSLSARVRENMKSNSYYVKRSHRDEFRMSRSCMRFLLVRVQFARVMFLGSSSEFCLFTLHHLIRHT